MYLSSNIKFLREFSHLTQPEFGKLFGKSRSNIDSYERGLANPSHETISAIARYYKLPMETIINKDFRANPSMLYSTLKENENNAAKDTEIKLKAKDELIKELRAEIKRLQAQNDSLINKLLA